MLRQYLVGAAASVCNIAIHALVMESIDSKAFFSNHAAEATLRGHHDIMKGSRVFG